MANENTSLLEKALRNKYRYPFNGQISTEDLYDLTPVQLDKVYQSLSKMVRKLSDDSLLDTPTTEDTILSNKMEIVRSVFEYKKQAAEKSKKAAETRKMNQKILDLIASKEDDALAAKSIDELKGLLVQEDGED